MNTPQNPNPSYGPTFPGGSAMGTPTTGGVVPPKKKKGSGCLLTGCLTVIIFIVLLVTGVYLAFRQLSKGVLEFASDQPAPVQVVELTDRQYETTETKLKNFLSQLEAQHKAQPGQSADVAPLELTTEDLNAIIHQALFAKAQLQQFPIAAHIQDGKIKIETSFPLGAIYQPDKYFNATAVLAPTLEGSTLHLNPRSIVVGGHSVPPEWLEEHSMQTKFDLRESNSAEVRSAAQKIEKLEVVADKVVITPRVPGQ